MPRLVAKVKDKTLQLLPKKFLLWAKKKFGKKDTGIPCDPWLSKFRFRDLPEELQCLIGEFTVECRGPIKIPRRQSMRKPFDLDDNFFAMIRAYPHLRKPLLRHFFASNMFDFEFSKDDSFSWFGAPRWDSGHLHNNRYLGYVRHVAVGLAHLRTSTRMLNMLWYFWAYGYTGLEVLEVKVDYMEADKIGIERQQKKYRHLFEYHPKLRQILFRPLLEAGEFEERHMPDYIIRELKLTPGAEERDVGNVVVRWEERGTTRPERYRAPLVA